jgi:hypothetical protein
MNGLIVETEFYMATSFSMKSLEESTRRKPGAAGVPIRLSDGHEWLFAIPQFCLNRKSLTTPAIDLELDELFESSTLEGNVSLRSIFSACRLLLLENYLLTDLEIANLLSLASADEAKNLADATMGILFGVQARERSYSDWIRTSLLANGIGMVAITSDQVSDVMNLLVATKRTIPAQQFINACAVAAENSVLESLV